LRNFRSGNDFKKASYGFIAKELLTQREKEVTSRIFKELDVDGDGKLSMREM
jgi:Ca2+-binding EF-hand superfamily protein